jgi:serine/threonine protein kinase
VCSQLSIRPSFAGTGTFGRVRLCSLNDDARSGVDTTKIANQPKSKVTLPKFYALKIMKKLEVVRLKQVEHIRNEKEILLGINHPFLVTLCALATHTPSSRTQDCPIVDANDCPSRRYRLKSLNGAKAEPCRALS